MNSNSRTQFEKEFLKSQTLNNSICNRNSQSKLIDHKQSKYSQIDNKENRQIQKIQREKISYGSRYQKQLTLKKQPQIIEQPSPIDYEKILQVIFKFYASFGDRTNTDCLHSNKIHKLLSDAHFQTFDQKSIDLLYIKINKGKPLNYENFLYFLEYLKGEQSFQYFIQDFFVPLYENILIFTDMGEEEMKLQQKLDQACIKLIHVILQPLNTIYQKYFPRYFRNFKMKDTSEESIIRSQTKSSLIVFLKEFEICPQFITISQAHLLYDSILKDANLPLIINTDASQKFNLNAFCCFLLKLPQMIFTKQIKDDDLEDKETPLQQLAFLFERMELSKGFSQIDVPSTQNKMNWKLKVSEQIIEAIIYEQQLIENEKKQKLRMKSTKPLKEEKF